MCPDISTVHILNDTRPNTIIATFIATDADIGENAELTYELRDGVSRETLFFGVNSSSGEIYTKM